MWLDQTARCECSLTNATLCLTRTCTCTCINTGNLERLALYLLVSIFGSLLAFFAGNPPAVWLLCERLVIVLIDGRAEIAVPRATHMLAKSRNSFIGLTVIARYYCKSEMFLRRRETCGSSRELGFEMSAY